MRSHCNPTAELAEIRREIEALEARKCHIQKEIIEETIPQQRALRLKMTAHAHDALSNVPSRAIRPGDPVSNLANGDIAATWNMPDYDVIEQCEVFRSRRSD